MRAATDCRPPHIASMPQHHPSTFAATIPASYALSLVTLMVERGHAADNVLANTQLSRDQLQDQRAQVGAWQYAACPRSTIRVTSESA